jgi:HAD superfamily hydrolase (TIGR01509 family)
MSADNRHTNNKRALIFDFDGLILDTETAEVEIWTELYSQVGLSFNMDAYMHLVGANGERGFHPADPISDRPGEERSNDQVRVEHRRLAWEKTLKLQPLEGVVDLIHSAKTKGYTLAIGSSANYDWVSTHLKRLGLFEYFDTIVTFDDVEEAKPAPDIYLKVLEKLNISGDQAIVLEDSYNGVLAARRAGIRAVAVPNPITKDQDFSLAESVLDSMRDIDLNNYF